MMSSRGICGTCVMDEVRKAVEIDYGLLELLEFWKYEVTCKTRTPMKEMRLQST